MYVRNCLVVRTAATNSREPVTQATPFSYTRSHVAHQARSGHLKHHGRR